MPLIKYVDKNNLKFFYRQIKYIIQKTGVGVTDITSETAIPKLVSAGSCVYSVDTSTTAIPKKTTADGIPSAATSRNLFIVDNCTTLADGSIINSYMVFDESEIYIGRITTKGSTDAVGNWSAVSNPDDSLVTMNAAEYKNLSEAEKNNGKAYFVPDAETGSTELPTAFYGIEITQADFDKLSDAEKNNDSVYFIKDKNGSYGAVYKNGVYYTSSNKNKSVSQAEYNGLSAGEKGNGTVYFVSDGTSGGGTLLISQLMNDSSSNFVHKGETTLSALPTEGMEKGWYYYIIDTGDGRYYDGTEWKVVK